MEAAVIYPRLVRRVRAALIDSVITVFIIFSWWLSLPLVVDYPAAIKFAYPLTAWFILDPLLVWRLGGTPGHYIMNLRVQCSRNAHNLGLLRAVLRSLLKILTGWWSFIFVLMTRRHQAFHDVLTFSIVTLRKPELLSKGERIHERSQDLANYRYPSVARRLLVMSAYLILSLVVYAVLISVTLTEECLNAERCHSLDETISAGLSIVWCLGVTAVLVYGWRSQIYGARRKAISESE